MIRYREKDETGEGAAEGRCNGGGRKNRIPEALWAAPSPEVTTAELFPTGAEVGRMETDEAATERLRTR